MKSPKEQKTDSKALLASSRVFARRMLSEYGEFLPFGEIMRPDGAIVSIGATTRQERSLSKDLIEILKNSYRGEARLGKILVCVIVYNVVIQPPNSTEKKDAMGFLLEHRDGYSAEVYYPYAFTRDNGLVIDSPFAQLGARDIFPDKIPG